MACLAIVQHEQGHVSRREPRTAVAAYLGMAPIAVHEVTTFYNMYNQQPVGPLQAQRLHQPAVRAARRRQGARAPVPASSASSPTAPRADGLFTVQPSECLGACADAPVMLVNDRQMLSFMSNDRLDELVDTLKAQPRDVTTMLDLSKFQASGARDLLPRPPHRAADLRRAGRQQLAAAGLRGARRLPGAEARSWRRRAGRAA